MAFSKAATGGAALHEKRGRCSPEDPPEAWPGNCRDVLGRRRKSIDAEPMAHRLTQFPRDDWVAGIRSAQRATAMRRIAGQARIRRGLRRRPDPHRSEERRVGTEWRAR